MKKKERVDKSMKRLSASSRVPESAKPLEPVISGLAPWSRNQWPLLKLRHLSQQDKINKVWNGTSRVSGLGSLLPNPGRRRPPLITAPSSLDYWLGETAGLQPHRPTILPTKESLFTVRSNFFAISPNH